MSIGLLAYGIEVILPLKAPAPDSTLTPLTQATPFEVGSYDVLGKAISRAEVKALLQTEDGKVQLASENGAIEVTNDLIKLGKDAFYRETFGNEYFFTDVVGAIASPINLVSMSKAILALKGEPTTNLQESIIS